MGIESFRYGENQLTPSEEVVFEEYRSSKNSMWKLNEVNPWSFRDLYGDDEVERDLRWVQETRAGRTKDGDVDPEKVHSEQHERSMLFEGLMVSALDQGGEHWLGSNTFVSRTHEYDDFRGTDLVLEFLGEDGDIERLAVDLTVSSEQTARAKTQKLVQQIERGSMARVKYFRSTVPEQKMSTSVEGSEPYKGRLVDIPKVIIGISPESLGRLIKPFSELLEKQDTKSLDAVDNHPIQFEILNEIITQLEIQRDRIPDLAPPHRQEEMVGSINRVLERVFEIQNKKEGGTKEKAVASGFGRDRTIAALSSEAANLWPSRRAA